jgi:ArsR family transcriptional regulator
MRELTAGQSRDLAATLRVIAEPTRLQLIGLLAKRPGTMTDLTGCLQLAGHTVAVSTVRHHLLVLVDAGMASREPKSTHVIFRLIPETFAAVADLVRAVGGR